MGNGTDVPSGEVEEDGDMVGLTIDCPGDTVCEPEGCVVSGEERGCASDLPYCCDIEPLGDRCSGLKGSVLEALSAGGGEVSVLRLEVVIDCPMTFELIRISEEAWTCAISLANVFRSTVSQE